MGYLFNKKVINKYLDEYEIENFDDKYNVIENWNRNLESLKGVNEKALQTSFIAGVFYQVLGYTNRPEANEEGLYTSKAEPTTEIDATHPDGTLGVFNNSNKIDDKTIAVIELKSPKTSLNTKQKRAKKDYGTPVEQAFQYASKYDGCKWVIVSNMIETRLYKYGRGQGHYTTFKIEELLDKESFKKFHLLLSEDNLIHPVNPNESITKKLSERTVKHNEDISVEFYNIYKNIRIELFEHLKEYNSDYDEEVLLEKAQKFLDRIIFICFCEDRLLLPNDILHKIITENKDMITASETPIWDGIRGLFKMIDKGNERHSINGFNGTLFKEDTILQDLIIQDDFFDSVYKISDYDFESELEVNILGHIFEQSINDIEEIKSDINNEEFDSEESKRKKDGIFYTPKYIVRYIVENSVDTYLENIKEELGYYDLPEIESGKNASAKGKYRNQHLEFYTDYEKILKEIKVLDPACGSGAFLNEAFDFLLKEHQWIHEQKELLGEKGQRTIFGLASMQKDILKNNIFGVDLNKESVEITKLSLWLKTADKDKKLTNLDDNIKCGNSLIDDPAVAGNKAFNWEEEFNDIMRAGGFNVVIGNPPYFNVQTFDAGDPKVKYLKEEYSEIWMDKSDILFYFIKKALDLVSSEGEISFIVSNAFLFSNKAQKLRNYLLRSGNLKKIINFEKYMIFEDASITSLIFQLEKGEYPGTTKVLNFDEKNYTVADINNKLNNEEEYFDVKLKEDSLFALTPKAREDVYKSIDEGCVKLKKVAFPGKGMETACNEVFMFESLPKDFPKEFIKKRISGRNIFRYQIKGKMKYLLYFNDVDKFEKLPKSIQEYLLENEDKLKDRATVKNEGRVWWKYSRPLHKEYYHLNKIWTSYRSRYNCFAYDDTNNYIGLTNTTVIFETEEEIDLKYILALLNSKLLNFRYKAIGKETGKGIKEYFEHQISKLPIPKIPLKEQQVFIDKVEIMQKNKGELDKTKEKEFKEYTNKYTSNNGPTIANILDQADFCNEIYSGRAREVRELTVNINDKLVTIYADKSSSGQYELFKFEVDDKYKRQYLKYYLENLTDKDRERINDYSGSLPKRVKQIEIPDFDKYQVCRKVISEWENLQREIEELEEDIAKTDKEIDQLVYDLYGLTDEEIEIIEESIN